VTPDDLVERVAHIIAEAEYGIGTWATLGGHDRAKFMGRAAAIVNLCRTHRFIALEEAAKVAIEYQHPPMALYPHSTGIAAAIRAMIRD